jgi:hypothetical protein
VHASLAAILKKFLGPRTSGFLLQSTSGKPLTQRNIIRNSLHKPGVRGFHPFHMFRVGHLRDLGTPQDILRVWSVHAGQSVTDHCSKMSQQF